MEYDYIILGGGISGLSLALELANRGRSVALIEKEHEFGGLARTISFANHLFDIGPHGIYCKNETELKWFQDHLGSDMVPVDRNSYTLFRGNLIPYPINAGSVLKAVSPFEVFKIGMEAGILRMFKQKLNRDASFKKWAIHHFGKTIYEHFFKDYTEKVWGVRCHELSTVWISKHLPANSLLFVLYKKIKRIDLPIGFVNKFYYCTKGSGHLIVTLKKKLDESNSVTLLKSTIINRLIKKNNHWTVTLNSEGSKHTITGKQIISTIPIVSLLESLGSSLPADVIQTAHGLRYRNIILILVVVDKPQVSHANWIYIREKRFKVSRISEYKNFIGSLRNRLDTALSLEIFCWDTDEIWSAPNEEIVDETLKEIQELGIFETDLIKNIEVIRIPNAYPVFDLEFESRMVTINNNLQKIGGIHLIGRTGAFKYLDMTGCVNDAICFIEKINSGTVDINAGSYVH